MDSGAGARCVVIVPARYGSSRLPGKPLLDIGGEPLVERVRRRAVQSAADAVVVATDDPRVASVVREGGGDAVLTGPAPSGTHRVALASEGLACGYVINVQCDQPDLDPAHVNEVIALLRAGADVATLATPLQDDPSDPATVKVVCDRSGHALYFSRAPIPHGGPWLRHLGIYGFTRAALSACVTAQASPLERSEDLEQLRWLTAGIRIRVGLVQRAAGALDTPRQLLPHKRLP